MKSMFGSGDRTPATFKRVEIAHCVCGDLTMIVCNAPTFPYVQTRINRDGALIEFECLFEYLETVSGDGDVEVITASGMVAGVLSRTRPCPRRYKIFATKWRELGKKQRLKVTLDVNVGSARDLARIAPEHEQTVKLLNRALHRTAKPSSWREVGCRHGLPHLAQNRPAEFGDGVDRSA